MRLMPALTFALALAIAFSMVSLSGFGAEFGYDPQTGIDEEFDEVTGPGDDDGGGIFDFDPDEGGSSFLGSVVSAINALRDLGSIFVFLPSTLQTLGFPGWASQLVGRTAQGVVLVLGIAQVVRGFEIR